MYQKYPSVTKIIWETKPLEIREKIEKFSKEEYKNEGIAKHKQIDDNTTVLFGNKLIDIKSKYGEPLYQEKFLKCNRFLYCGKIDYFTRDFNLIEWKFVQRENSISLSLPDYQLQLGAYYNFLRRFSKIKATLVIFCKDTGNIIEFHYDKEDLVIFKKRFLLKLKEFNYFST